MKTRLVAIIGITAVVMAAGAAQAAEVGGKAPIECFMCGMSIHTDGNLHVKFVMKDGAIKYVDDVSEAAKALGGKKDEIARTVVFDHGTGKEVLSQKAFAVIGSKFKPPFQTMSPDIVLFFDKKSDAEKAAKKFGGRVGTFDEAIAAVDKSAGGHGHHKAGMGVDKGKSCGGESAPGHEGCGGHQE